MILLLLTSIIGIILYVICTCLFTGRSNAEIILNGFVACIPIVGALRFLFILINGILYHTHPLNKDYTNLDYKSVLFDDALKVRDTKLNKVRDTKLNRWLFNDIDWKKYDTLNKGTQ